MPDVRPLSALMYDPSMAGPLELNVAEPYDKVTESMRASYLKGSPYNVVRVDLPREEADAKDRYRTAADVFRGWVAKGIVRRASGPAFYLYEQGFALAGDPEERPLTRRALIGLVEAREHAKGHVLPHERTFREPKADRMSLLEAVRAHFGMCFLLYADPERRVERALAGVLSVPTPPRPLADFTLRADGTTHRLTAIDDPAAIAAIRAALQPKTTYIADGHHRYETAIAFRREHEKKGDMRPGYAYRTAALVDIADPGLKILPTHRLLPKEVAAERLIEAARPWFTLAEGEPPTPERRRLALLVVGPDGGRRRLALRADVDLARELPGVTKEVGTLAVTILHKLVLEKGLGIEAGAKEHSLGYVRLPEEGLQKVASGAHGCMVMLPGTTPEQVLAVADAGAVMPQKSTDFYPKLLSGLVLNDIEDPLHG